MRWNVQYRRTCCITILVLLALPLSFTGQENSKAGPASKAGAGSRNVSIDREKATVAELEEEWLSALTTPNVDKIAEILADDFVRPAADEGRFIGRSELLAFYRSHLHPDSSKKRRIEDMKVTIYGSTALARGTLITANAEGAVISKMLFTDVFVQRNGKWLAVSAQENAAATTPATGH